MALFTNLPVFKQGYDLLLEIYKRTKNLPREYKYTLGERLKNEGLDMLINIYKANKSKRSTRLNYIENARENVETLRLIFRVASDLKVIGTKSFSFLTIKIEELSKQLTAWQKYTAGAAKN